MCKFFAILLGAERSEAGASPSMTSLNLDEPLNLDGLELRLLQRLRRTGSSAPIAAVLALTEYLRRLGALDRTRPSGGAEGRIGLTPNCA